MFNRLILPAFLLLAGPALAQERTQANYGDWALRCESRPQRQCELATVLNNAEGRPQAQLIVGRLHNAGPLLLMAHVPLNVHLPAGIRVEAAGQSFTLAYQRCLAAGCFAMAELPDAALAQLRSEPPGARMVLQDAARQPVTLNLSMSGFGRAQAAMSSRR
ncbi:invasion associated locus B family protein [Rhodovarius crocodyli]|nr:invasion associated locus B family protein [Rhodovarius crocodyli]